MNGNRVPVEHVADQRADAAVADNDDARRLALRRDLRRLRRRPRLAAREPMRAPSFARPGIDEHRDRDRADERGRQRAIDEASGERGADHHEAELAAGPEQEATFRRAARDGRRKARPSPNSDQTPSTATSAAGETKDEAGPREDEAPD